MILNAGKVGIAWTGGEHWKNKKIVETLTGWVANGGGFIGVGEPSSIQFSSQYFQLAHILGVDREIGLTTNKVKLEFGIDGKNHFILQDNQNEPDFGKDIDNVYVLGKSTQVLSQKEGSVRLALNEFGNGKAVYLSGFKFAPENTRLLHRSLFWAAGKEADFAVWSCSNVFTDCAFYPNIKKLVVISSSDHPETTKVFGANGQVMEVALEPHGIKIIDVNP